MADFIINEKQLLKIEEIISRERDFKLAEENWNKFSKEEKESIVECLKHLYPEKAKSINEAAWYNTLGDVIGLFDPTGVVDLVNGISYIAQGDNLFGFLSMISAVPYIGDVVAKPVMAALKIGAPGAKALEGVMKLFKAGKTAEASAQLSKLTAQGGLTGKFVEGFGKIATKLRGYIERMPLGVFKGFKKTILGWFDLFENAAKTGSAARKGAGDVASQMATSLKRTGGKALAPLEKSRLEALLSQEIANAKNIKGAFTGYRTSKGILSWKTLFRGMPQVMGRNASVRALMRQTKWWLGFLDYIGFGNFVGPDEVLKQMGEEKFVEKMESYNNTETAQQNYESDFGKEPTNQQTSQTSQSNTQQATGKEKDPFANFLNKLFTDAINPVPGM